jgi:hypothetical protein
MGKQEVKEGLFKGFMDQAKDFVKSIEVEDVLNFIGNGLNIATGAMAV